MNLPDYEFLSAPLWLITTLHLVTLTLHFVAMNFLFGGLIITSYAAIKRRWDDPTLKQFRQMFPSVMAATVTLGVAPLLFLQMVYPQQVYAAAIVSGWFWLFVIAVVIVAYYALYRSALKDGGSSVVLLLLALAGAAYVSLTYSSVFAMAERPNQIRDLYAANQSGWVWNPAAGDWVLRWLHMVLGAVTVGGFIVGMIGRERAEVFALGKNFFLGGTVLAALAGVAYLMTLAPYLKAFMQSPAIWALTVGVVLALGSLPFFFKKNFCVSGTMLFVSMVMMVFARHTVRLLKLTGQFDPATWRVAPQWGVFALFLVCFVVMLLVVGYMFRLVLRSKPSACGSG
jgi:hypothetical protein